VGDARPVDPSELVLRPQLLAGFSDDEVRRLVRAGRRTPVRRGVYVHGGVPDDVLARHALHTSAAMGALAGDAVVSHVAAAVLHGLRVWGVRLDRVHVTRPRRTGGRCGALVHLHPAALDPGEIVMIAGLPVTSLARGPGGRLLGLAGPGRLRPDGATAPLPLPPGGLTATSLCSPPITATSVSAAAGAFRRR
jgi:hypothetical protein